MVTRPFPRTFLIMAFLLFCIVPKAQIYFVNLEALITDKVKEEMSQWSIQGEFETTAEYRARMKQKDQKIRELTEEAKDYYMQDYIDRIDFTDIQISRYDADRQTFKMTLPLIGDFILPVEREYAPDFKKKALRGGISIKNPDFVIRNNSWQLSRLEVVCDNRTYVFDIRKQVGYDPKDDFLVEAEDLDIDIDISNPGINNGNIYYDDRSMVDMDTDYDISTNLPRNKAANDYKDAIAIVIGNRNYKLAKNVDYAIQDALRMKQYLVEVVGFREGNVILVRNASKGQFENIFGTAANHKGTLYDFVKPNKSDVFVYYSGHGAPGLEDKNGYFVPVECNPKKVQLAGYPLDLFYTNLKKIPSKSTTVVLDACFSGADILDGISPIGIRRKAISNNDKNTVVLASSSAAEVSTWYHAKKHGMFTYYFLKAIHDKENADKNRDGELTFTEIHEYVSDKVRYGARRLHGLDQNPELLGGNKEGILFKYQ